MILRGRIRSSTAALALLASLETGFARAEEEQPLRFTVGPSAAQGEETLDQKLARRDRFRFICVGCVRVPGQPNGATFRPIETLNAPQLTRALAPPPPDPQEDEGSAAPP